MKILMAALLILSMICNVVVIYKLIDTSTSLMYINASNDQNSRLIHVQKKIVGILVVDRSRDYFLKKIEDGYFDDSGAVVKIQDDLVEIDEVVLVFKDGSLVGMESR